MDSGQQYGCGFLFNGTDIHSGDYDEDSGYLRKEGDENSKEERTRAGQVFQTILSKAWTYLTMRMQKRCTNMTMVIEIWLCDDWMYLIWCITNHGQIVRVNNVAQKLLENVS